MADTPVAAEAGAAPKKKGKLMLIIGIAVFVLLAGGGAAAFFLMKGGDHDKKAKEEKKEPAAPALFVALDPPFVVNFEGDQSVRFLQVTVQIMTRDPATVEELKANDPVVRNDLLLLFSNQKYEVASSRAGQEKLRTDALATIRKVVESAGGKPATIERVLFTSFVMQ